MTLDAIIQQINRTSLFVREMGSNNEFLVNVSNTQGFRRGDCIRINHTGQMTLSIPPQIIATSIRQIQCNPINPPSHSRPSEMTAIILQRRRNELVVRDINNNSQIIVITPHAHHFCVRQRIIITHDTIRMSNPPKVDAIDIRPIC